MKTSKKLWLSVAPWRDTCMMIIQDRDYVSFCTNSAKVTGKGLNLIQQHARQQKEESSFIDSCCEALESGDIEAEVMAEMIQLNIFYLAESPSKGCLPHLVKQTLSKEQIKERLM